MPQGIGKQQSSRLPTAPSYGFGSAPRFGYETARPSTSAGRLASPRREAPAKSSSPGPGAYSSPSTIGRQSLGRFTSSPSYGFGSADRDTSDKVYLGPAQARLQAGRHSPGPATAGQGQQWSAMGRQSESSHLNSPSYGFGSGGRGDGIKDNGVPGPDAYAPGSSMGPQASSRTASPPRFSFGGGRDAQTPRYIGPAYVKMNHGKSSPGPATYGPHSRPLTPSYKFGKADRFATQERLVRQGANSPGPGAYNA